MGNEKPIYMKKRSRNYSDPLFQLENDRLETQLEQWREKRKRKQEYYTRG